MPFLNIPKKLSPLEIRLVKKNTRPLLCVLNGKMNTILAVCSEYSDNVWYSGFEVDNVPSKIAIEIGRKYRFAFLKLMSRKGYSLDSMKRGDDEHCILTLVKSEKEAFCQ